MMMGSGRRRTTRRVHCGLVAIGGGAPVSIQSMTNTDTRDVAATREQIARLRDAGCQIVRLAVPDMEAAVALETLKKDAGLPLVADIHFDHRLALEAIRRGADKIRINPGNIGGRDRVTKVAKAARERGIPIRVGVNAGSLEKDVLRRHGGVTPAGLAESALRNVRLLEELGFSDMVISLKASGVPLNYEAYRRIAAETDYPLHIGVTESGTSASGRIRSAIGIGALLLEGIGDTLRVSLTGDPVQEVLLGKEILEAVELRRQGIRLISCPTCGRTRVGLEAIAREIEERSAPLSEEREARGLPGLTVAVMGCAVNGPGEARDADLGIACGAGNAVLFRKGEILRTLREEEIVDVLLRVIDEEGR